ncbi:porin family protein [Faecalibacter bovis]|uniref:Outer membrane protein beta-barrel domain-containing protein n=1 Tax=Faecalibacter bovis TaxID=2898187 RepID=A0ABX7XFV4_9FLAO|nr:porin family protein [Faecalibacter bovis]QTV06820.1 hypothetical protein J9309_05760 [Faecalibacter bovis]
MNKFDHHIKNKLSEHQTPPIDAWKNIEEKLDQKKKKRIIPFIFWISSSAACLGIAGVTYFFHAKENTTNQPEIVHKDKTINSILKKNNTLDSLNNLKDTNKIINIVNNGNKHSKSESYNKTNQLNSVKNSDFKSAENDYNNFDLGEYLGTKKTNSTNNQQVIDEKIFSNQLITQNQIDQKDESNKEKTIEEILIEEKAKVDLDPKKLDPKTKFSVSTFVSTSTFLKEESILSNSFNTHEIDNKVTVAYGAKLAYQINDKLKIRTGISKLDFDQNTKDVVMASTSAIQSTNVIPLSSNIRTNNNNIKYNGNLQVITNHQDYPTTFYSTEKNTMNQRVEFLEIPVEIEYRLNNKSQFNIYLVGGGSYMILTKNDIFIDNQTYGRSKIGKAENLNDYSYSANAGLKFEYLLSEKAGINLEPNYKFLINPLNNFSNKENSLLGIGIGFSYKF